MNTQSGEELHYKNAVCQTPELVDYGAINALTQAVALNDVQRPA